MHLSGDRVGREVRCSIPLQPATDFHESAGLLTRQGVPGESRRGLDGLGQGLAKDLRGDRSWEFAWRWRKSLAGMMFPRVDAYQFGVCKSPGFMCSIF